RVSSSRPALYPPAAPSLSEDEPVSHKRGAQVARSPPTPEQPSSPSDRRDRHDSPGVHRHGTGAVSQASARAAILTLTDGLALPVDEGRTRSSRGWPVGDDSTDAKRQLLSSLIHRRRTWGRTGEPTTAATSCDTVSMHGAVTAATAATLAPTS